MLNSILFVHGLRGNRRDTWTHENKVFWPEEILPKDLPTARIMTFGYDADVVGITKTAGSNTLRDHGKSLANALAMRRARSNSTDRPLIFVAHSLGGLVVEQVRQERVSSGIDE
jgi:protein SERAC1